MLEASHVVDEERVEVDGKRLETRRWSVPAPRGTILLLHEALGSVAYWKDFPTALASGTQHTVIAYSRAGHGESDGPVEARTLAYYAHEVERVVPEILAHFQVKQAVLYGHSEGAVIALLFAASSKSVRALIAECPVVVPEERTAATIDELAAAWSSTDFAQRLGRYHRDADAVFHAWMQNNRSSLLKDFPLHQHLSRIHCPVLVLQGAHDDFASIVQFQTLAQSLPQAQHAMLEAGHLLHREQPEQVIDAVQEFLLRLAANSIRTIEP